MTQLSFSDEKITSKADPYELLEHWLQVVADIGQLNQPRAMTLSTLGLAGDLHSRVVLFKQLIKTEGLVFYTNYESQKGQDLQNHPKASLNFYWDFCNRQVRLVGDVTKVERRISEEYWQTRPRGSQVSQSVSDQSKQLPLDRRSLDDKFAQAEELFANQEIPCPQNWGGYLFRPKSFEFWIARENRLHDRYLYSAQPTASEWLLTRLAP